MRPLVLPLVLIAAPLAAQQMTGFTPASAAREAGIEAVLRAGPDTASARRHAHVLAGQAHVAGTPRQAETADYVLRQMAAWGLDTSRTSYRVYMPFQDSAVVELVQPVRRRLSLDEPPVAEDPTSQLAQWPAMNGYSGVGDVTAGVVYVNYGLPADYAVLDSMGIAVRGKVAVARYGRSFRGIKAREAEARGAAALILYSDPADDGYSVGDVYPTGPMRNASGVQRGSIFNGSGDPSTPTWASTDGARRIPESEMEGIAHIPVIPIGYGNASEILGRLDGPSVANPWQGGLGFRYHVTGDAVRLRVGVWAERGPAAYKTIINTFGRIRGSDRPGELVLVGGHRDAWGPGALDDVSGTISVLEAAEAWGKALAKGIRPRRTLVFATWDAEEWGLIGSSEWAEAMADTLRRGAVAYINQDVVAGGRSFGGSGTASLQDLMRAVTKTIDQPGDSGSVYAAWARRATSSDRPEPPMGDLGGGSDFAGLYNFLGVPTLEFGFGGRGGSYHSAYDTWSFAERFADPGYLSHRAAGQVAAVLMARLANADVIPVDAADLGTYLGTLVERTRREPGARAIAPALDDLAAAASQLAEQGRDFRVARDRALAAGRPFAEFTATNDQLRVVEQQMLRDGGLKDRPFYRNLLFASDRDNGYANVQLPSIVEALRDNDTEAARLATAELAQKVRAAATVVAKATAALP